MKKIVFTVMLSTLCLICNAQFVLTPGGIRSESDTSKNYVILDFNEQTKSDLFQKTKDFLSVKYVSPKSTLNESVSGELSLNGVTVITVKNPRGGDPYDMTYRTQFSFKESKIKISFEIVSMIDPSLSKLYIRSEGGLSASIYGKKGNLRFPNTKLQIEKFSNEIIVGLQESINGVKKEDW